MANFNTINAYDADCRIPGFLGLNQYGDVMNADPRYAVEAENMDTQGGTLKPFAKPVQIEPGFEDNPIETLMRMYRRWTDGQQEIIVAAVGGRIAYKSNGKWFNARRIDDRDSEFQCQSNVWSWVTYEINPSRPDYSAEQMYAYGDYCTVGDLVYRCKEDIETPEEFTPEHWELTDGSSVDVLLISNAVDGMFLLRGDVMMVQAVETPAKFGVIERYAERIWGSAIADEPDTLWYSRPYDPLDWRQAGPSELPENGAGPISQPSWDGDAFVALKAFGSQMIAFKRTRVWRVLGTDPGEYAFKEQYGGGTAYPNTIAVDAERIYMLTDRGVAYYDGNTVNPFQRQTCADVWHRLNISAMHQSSACLWHDKYYVAIPIDGSEVCNAVLIYNLVDGTWLLRTDLMVESWLGGENNLYFTSSTTPGYMWEYKEDAWLTGEASTAATKWVTPWNNLNYQDMRKGPFRIYLTPEVQTDPVDLTITLDTDNKRREKTVRIHPMLEIEQYYHKEHKPICVHIPGGGKRFRLTVSTPENSPVWRLRGGIMTVADIAAE